MSISIYALQPSTDTYLISVDDTRGQVFELSKGKAFPPREIELILASGFWAENDMEDEDSANVLDAFRKAKGAILKNDK